MILIPAIDIIDGKCVRLTQGDYQQKKIYNQNPLEVAKQFEGIGLNRLHLVDLDGAKQKKIVNAAVLEQIATRTKLHIDFGGGVQSEDDLKIAFDAGAAQVTGGSIAVKDPKMFEHWIATFGKEHIILGADARNNRIAVSGWQEDSGKDIFDFVENFVAKGIKYCISTDVDKDGLLQGPCFELYQTLQQRCPSLNIIASGGVSCVADLEKLAETTIFGVIVGKAIYENRISINDLKRFAV